MTPAGQDAVPGDRGGAAREPRAGGEAPGRRSTLRVVLFAWVFGAAWMYITGSAAFTRFGQLLHLTGFQFGLLAGLPYAAALGQLPVSYAIERFGCHKALFIGAGVVHRGLWIAIALIPWLLPERAWAAGFLMLAALAGVAGNATYPAWVAWMADVVPSRIRGRYFSRRIQLGQAVGLVATLLMGLLLDRATAGGGGGLRAVIAAAFAVGGVCGIVDFLLFLRVPPPARCPARPAVSLRSLVREPLSDPNFRRFLGFNATLVLGTGYVGQFIWLYVLDVARMSNTQATLATVFLPLVVTMAVFPLWGRVIDRAGRRPVLVVCGMCIVAGAASWIFVTAGRWFPGYFGVLLAVAAWPGIELASFNIFLGMSDVRGGRRNYASACVAINSAVTALAGTLSGLLGGAVAHALRGWRASLCGWPLTHHGVLFLLSGALRLAALAWVIGLQDRGAYGTRGTLRYVGASLTGGLVDTILIPGRLLARLGRWTYKLNPGTARGRGRDTREPGRSPGSTAGG